METKNALWEGDGYFPEKHKYGVGNLILINLFIIKMYYSLHAEFTRFRSSGEKA